MRIEILIKTGSIWTSKKIRVHLDHEITGGKDLRNKILEKVRESIKSMDCTRYIILLPKRFDA